MRNEVGDEVMWDKAIRMNKRYFSVKLSCQTKNWGKSDTLRYTVIFLEQHLPFAVDVLETDVGHFVLKRKY